MSMEYGNLDLEDFIEREIKSLHDYISKGNVNPQYIEMKNKKISELTEINNGIYLFKHSHIWEWVEASMENLETRNPYLVGHLIEFNVDYSKWNWSKIRVPDELL